MISIISTPPKLEAHGLIRIDDLVAGGLWRSSQKWFEMVWLSFAPLGNSQNSCSWFGLIFSLSCDCPRLVVNNNNCSCCFRICQYTILLILSTALNIEAQAGGFLAMPSFRPPVFYFHIVCAYIIVWNPPRFASR